jgi:hypothetical protein
MGCSDCNNKGGCGVRKGEEKQLLGSLLPRLYPSGRWGVPDDEACFRQGVTAREGRRLARNAAEVLQAPARFVPGDATEGCDYVYVLCVGREPGLVDLRDRPAIDLPDGDRIRERYLRAALSTMARIAAVQEIAFELDREGDVYIVREKPRDGVYDPILLARTQKLVDLLVGADITYLDFGLLTKPATRYAEGLVDADYEERYGQPAATVNWLFYPQPATTARISVIPAA